MDEWPISGERERERERGRARERDKFNVHSRLRLDEFISVVT